jgi:hypothetical protein
VTVQDINVAEKIFGLDVATLKGRTTKKKAIIVQNKEIKIPPELKAQCENLTFFIDIMFVNGMPMLTGIDNPVCFWYRNAMDLYEGIDRMLCFYNKNGFFVKTICADNEFRVLIKRIQDELGVMID